MVLCSLTGIIAHPLCVFTGGFRLPAVVVAHVQSHCVVVLQFSGLGPSLRTLSIISVTISANCDPIAADRLNIATRSPLSPIWSSNLATYFTRRLALVLPSR